MYKIVPIASLPQNKYRQLQNSATNPAMFISIEDYYFDKEIGAVVYAVEIGFQSGCDAVVNTVNLRFSQLEHFDRVIRRIFKHDSFLRPFPPKKWIGNTNQFFLEKRSHELQLYLENLTKVPGITFYPAFIDTFKLDQK